MARRTSPPAARPDDGRTIAPHDPWPALPLDAWQETYDTLHLWTQIVGKTRLALAPMENHWWQVVLYVTPRGLTTSAMPSGTRSVSVDFDFIAHRLHVQTSDGQLRDIPLVAQPVADFYAAYMDALRSVDVDVRISPLPNEMPTAIPFAEDRTHAAYDADAANRCWRILAQTDRVLKRYRGRFMGKASPVHFFWGGFDMAATRFSGRRAPPHGGGVPNCPDWVMLEAYSHECASCGFWPGGGAVAEPAFYAYSYPEPRGYAERQVRPDAARYDGTFGEFLLPYEAVRTARDPDEMLLDFFQSTYEAAADLANWDRAAFDRPPSLSSRTSERSE
jgi:hypothetical protein